MSRSTYSALLRSRPYLALEVKAAPGRLGYAAIPVSIVLSVKPLSLAGAATAAFAVASSVSGPMKGAMIDRADRRIVSGMVMMACACGFLFQMFAAHGWVVLVALLLGAVIPPTTGMARAAVSSITPSTSTATSALALDSVLEEALYIAGPALASAIAILATSYLMLAITACIGLSGCFLPNSPPQGLKAKTTRDRVLQRLGPTVLFGAVLAAVAVAGLVLGSDTVAFVKLASARHARAEAGIYLSALSVGSIVGGLIFGHLRRRPPMVVVTATLASTSVLPFLSGSFLGLPLAANLGTTVVAGLAISPLMTDAYVRISAGSLGSVSVYSTVSTAKNAAVAVGAAVSGVLIGTVGLLAGIVVIASIGVGLSAAVGILTLIGRESE